jgi:hypothetical protein
MYMFYVMCDASVLVGQLLALQEGSAVGWMTKESSIKFWHVRSFLSSSKYPNNLRPAQPHIQCVLRLKRLGQGANHLSLSSAKVKNVWICMCCTSIPLCMPTVWCLMKHGDSFTLYEVFSCLSIVLLTA